MTFSFFKRFLGGESAPAAPCSCCCSCSRPLFPEDYSETLKTLDPKIVIGRVKSVSAHPDPSVTRVQVTQTEVAPGQTEQILCGGSNVAEGILVAVATVGAKLSEDFEIGKRAIRGTESCGMICARKELNLPLDGEGDHEIWILPETCADKIGTPLCDLA